MQYGPDPNAIYPNEEIKNICYIKNVITRPNIIVGISESCNDLEKRLALCHTGNLGIKGGNLHGK